MSCIRTILIVCCATLCFACTTSTEKSSKSTEEGNNNQNEHYFKIDSITYIDSISLADNSNLWGYVKNSCTFPVQEDNEYKKCYTSVYNWIYDKFSDSSHVSNTIQELVRYAGQKQMKYLRSFADDDYGYAEFGSNLEEEITIEKIYENDTLLTLSVGHYLFLNGAHGSYHYEGATFNKKTGHKYDYDLLSLYDQKTLHRLCFDGLKQYFELKTDEELIAQLQEFYFTDDNFSETLPLPQKPPYVTEKGIEFCYQQYEIACYAAGLPSFTIPLPLKKD